MTLVAVLFLQNGRSPRRLHLYITTKSFANSESTAADCLRCSSASRLLVRASNTSRNQSPSIGVILGEELSLRANVVFQRELQFGCEIIGRKTVDADDFGCGSASELVV
ncbi:MAG: hypothetical protein JXB10_12255 [Pirellulales bacterium]|nr:hypothetical protein [Pirellulales bacterium]